MDVQRLERRYYFLLWSACRQDEPLNCGWEMVPALGLPVILTLGHTDWAEGICFLKSRHDIT